MIKIIIICFLFFNTLPSEGTANLGLSKNKAVGLHYHNNNFARDHAFLYISLPSLHDYNEKMPNFMFYGGRKQATMKFSFSF